MNQISQIATMAAQQAGKLIRENFQKQQQVSCKESWNLVTDIDVKAENLIIQTIHEAFPNHAFYTEESTKESLTSENLWIIDPVDGTNNFVHGIPHACVSIAYAKQGEVQLGVVYDPINQRLFSAQKNQGAYLNHQPIASSEAKELHQAILAVGFYYDRGKMMERTLRTIESFFLSHIRGIRRFGSAALDLCFIAWGCFDIYFEYYLSPWDFAAGVLIAKEAGATVTTTTGEEIRLDGSHGILACSPFLHQVALDIVSKK